MDKLIKLIIESPSIEAPEAQDWINLLQEMTPKQIERLKDILTREKKKQKEIQDKYDRKKKAVIKKTIKDNNLTSLKTV